MASLVDNAIVELLEEKGKMRTSEFYDALPQHSEGNIKKRLAILTKDNTIDSPKRGVYVLAAVDTIPQTRFHEAKKKFSSDERSAENNEQTINTLLNTYDEVLAIFQIWVLKNIASQEIDFEKQLLFIENFKWLTLIVDKLMKRWSLVHHGYDTNTRQAQEDAKAKTEERQKAALQDAPLEDTIMVVGKYDPKAMALIDCIPSSVENTDDLENMTDEEKEKTAV